ncbi:acetylornithine deacetylase [Filimonas lacunae]|uniref:Acetylornithine deacetylase n=1 Tax=Filimonas lacunae TaxID=477680 RepID=A0A173MPP9_9BACT|nr:M20 family metallo-hydrolase [Filimonas lacunae]BAV09624.1 acetylornithine deacetylase [Filimonas lacunae]SIS76079.1 acetylornithine deacetylase [Filimonas lacunae]
METAQLYKEALQLLQQLIATPSYSKEEDKTAAILEQFLQQKGVQTHRCMNNVWALNKHFDPAKPTVLLNSHHDTVKPNPQYTKDPFTPVIEEGRLYGLGSNDAGGCLVSLMAAFLYFYDQQNLKYNVIIGASAEEEISGVNGIEALLKDAAFTAALNNKPPAFAIVGEPTLLNLAIAEKGLMVLDGMAHGKAGHAAREEGENSVYKALKDIEWISTYRFPKTSEWLGPVKMSVTVINTENKAHNVVPAQCSFVVDVRVTDAYTHEEVLDIIRQHVKSEVKPRSLRMRATRIEANHPIVEAGIALGKSVYGSPTCSDKALMPFHALKCGPGDSARSHTADEFIYVEEIEKGIEHYIQLLNKVVLA